jgi:flagellar biosynthesis protein FliP
MSARNTCWLLLTLFLLPIAVWAQPGIEAITVTTGKDGSQSYSLTLQILVLMTALSVLPSIVLMMSCFTRIIIVLGILRQALGTAQTPSNQVLIGMAMFLTFFVMSPVFDKVYSTALTPYLEDKLSMPAALQKASIPVREFMFAQTRESDINLFAGIANSGDFKTPEDVPFSILVPSFVTSELKTAFQMGFLIFIPFLIIDLVVASVLMSMGMMMLSPMIISLPFKLMLFVLVDGWALIMGSLASSFFT